MSFSHGHGRTPSPSWRPSLPLPRALFWTDPQVLSSLPVHLTNISWVYVKASPRVTIGKWGKGGPVNYNWQVRVWSWLGKITDALWQCAVQNVNRYDVQKMFPGVNNILKIIDETKLIFHWFQENSVYIILQESLKGDCAVKHPPPPRPLVLKPGNPLFRSISGDECCVR